MTWLERTERREQRAHEVFINALDDAMDTDGERACAALDEYLRASREYVRAHNKSIEADMRRGVR